MYELDEDVLQEESQKWQKSRRGFLKALRYVLVAAILLVLFLVIMKPRLPHPATPAIQDNSSGTIFVNTSNFDALRKPSTPTLTN